jgi:hypothetical protein
MGSFMKDDMVFKKLKDYEDTYECQMKLRSGLLIVTFVEKDQRKGIKKYDVFYPKCKRSIKQDPDDIWRYIRSLSTDNPERPDLDEMRCDRNTLKASPYNTTPSFKYGLWD